MSILLEGLIHKFIISNFKYVLSNWYALNWKWSTSSGLSWSWCKEQTKRVSYPSRKDPGLGRGNWGIESSCLKIWTDMERLPVSPKDYWSELSHKQIFWYKDSVKKSSVNRIFENNYSHITRPWKRLRWSESFLASVNIQSSRLEGSPIFPAR